MRERELRLALVCYGGVSLAVYMHGITKEVWHLARASRAFCDDEPVPGGTAAVWRRLLDRAEAASGIRLRVLTDILSGASAGGINAVFLAQAIETGQSLEPLTDLWLDNADADVLVDPDARPISRFTKFWAVPIAWLLLRWRSRSVDRTVAPGARAEVRRKLSRFVRARWFQPPFGGGGFSHLLFDAFDAMAAAPCGPPLLPEGHPVDLFVTATDFAGHEEVLVLNSPAATIETEHRIAIGFSGRGGQPRAFADVAELVFAARATASFPGAFPPFTVRELDHVLGQRQRPWPGREDFLCRVLPRACTDGTVDDVALIDGSVLANAPFAQAIASLKNRPARREVDRRFVYLEPTPRRAGRAASGPPGGSRAVPGFFRTIFGAISDIPREQPIRDNLERIAERSSRIRRMQRIVEAMRPSIDASIERTIGRPLFADRPTPARLSAWRAKANRKAAQGAGFAFGPYGQLKLSGIVDDLTALLTALAQGAVTDQGVLRARLWDYAHAIGADHMQAGSDGDIGDTAITFLRDHDIGFRIRRLRFLARRLAEHEEGTVDDDATARDAARQAMRDVLYDAIASYAGREEERHYGAAVRAAARHAIDQPGEAMALIAADRNLKALDDQVEEAFAAALANLVVPDRRLMLRAYLGFPFYDIATLPMLQGEGLDEYDPIKVDRISPEDAVAIRSGGAAATLKGIEFNNFGAFFSRAYRENDYLWGRLHGADRLVDIMLSAVPDAKGVDAAAFKRDLFTAILDEEDGRLTLQADLIAALRQEIATSKDAGS